jgi:hypothetical protein
MANTVIQLKYSTATDIPSSLNVAEPAYSYTSNTLFIGSPAGTGSIAIGGKFYIDQQGLIYNHANAAFLAANNASDIWVRNQANGAFIAANSAGTYANAAFDLANTFASVNVTQNNNITAAFTKANGAFDKANSAYTNAGTAQTTADNAQNSATAAYAQANTATNTATAGYAQANTATNTATAAYSRANNSINANTGGTITADLVITGNLTVQGNTTYIDTRTITAGDSLIHLANNNTIADTVDIGFYGSYNSGGVKYTGLVRQAGADYFLFKGLTSDPTSNVLAAGSLTAANTGTLTANLNAYAVTIGGQDIQTYATNAYNTANTASNSATSAFLQANAAFSVANVNTGINVTQNNSITAAFAQANAAYDSANVSTGVNLTQNNTITAAFVAANAALANDVTQNNSIAAVFSLANGTALIANTDYTNISIGSADYGSGSSVAAFKVAANGRIISANTTTIALDASAISTGTLSVGRGGTGATSFTTNGVLLGAGGSALSTASSSTEGHVLTINNSGVPTFSHLSGGTF